MTTPSDDEGLREELEVIHKLMFQPSYAVIYPETEMENGYKVAKRIQALISQKIIEARQKPSVHIFDAWLSIDMGAEIRFEPMGMWGQRVWQNGATYVCSGIKKNEGCESITDSNDYRFTRIGSGSVGKEYDDVFITGKDIKRWYDNGATGDLKNLAGWFALTTKQDVKEIE